MTEQQTLSFTERLKQKWDLKNNTELFFVFVLFAATGVFCLMVSARPILRFFGMDKALTAPALYWPMAVLTVIPFFLVMLLFLHSNEKLKSRWLLRSNWQFFLVIVLFSITGSSSVRLARPILDYLHITDDTLPGYLYWPLRFLIVFPVYQLLFLVFGFFLGQWEFAWRFEKKMLGGFGRLFGVKPERKKSEQ